jgi:DNA ligase (NAD+)
MVFTGTLQSGTRDAAETRARELGARVSSAISAKTDLLVVGSDAGSKLAKAQGLIAKGSKLEILDEEAWLRIAG